VKYLTEKRLTDDLKVYTSPASLAVLQVSDRSQTTVLQSFYGGYMQQETLPQPDDLEYRDYLLQLEVTYWVLKSTYTSEFETPPSEAEIRQTTLERLKKKFKQDFSNSDNSLIGANKVSIEVLIDVLTEDFHILRHDIPPQDEQETDREYLDRLIALSKQTPETLRTIYRIHFSRQNPEQTTRVHENILTL
jgi:hypothetical protein